jgi:flagellin-like protein
MGMSGDTRGATPVVGAILLVAIVVILAATAGLFAFEETDTISDPGPTAAFDFEEQNDIVKVRHRGGDSINRENLAVRGGVIQTAPQTVRAGTTIEIAPYERRVAMIWEGNRNSAILASTSVASLPDSFSVNGPTDDSIEGIIIQQGTTRTIKNTGNECVNIRAEITQTSTTLSISPLFSSVDTDILPGKTSELKPSDDIKITKISDC